MNELLLALLGIMEHLQANTEISKRDLCWRKAENAVKKFTTDNEARRRARLAIGAVPRTKVRTDKRRKPVKHCKPLREDS